MGRERESESRPSGSDRSSGVSTRDASSVGKKKKKKEKRKKTRKLGRAHNDSRGPRADDKLIVVRCAP